jgi:hypothetical protein
MSPLMADTVARVFLHRPTKFFGPYARRSNNHLRDYLICDELTDHFGGGLGATRSAIAALVYLREIDGGILGV